MAPPENAIPTLYESPTSAEKLNRHELHKSNPIGYLSRDEMKGEKEKITNSIHKMNGKSSKVLMQKQETFFELRTTSRSDK